MYFLDRPCQSCGIIQCGAEINTPAGARPSADGVTVAALDGARMAVAHAEARTQASRSQERGGTGGNARATLRRKAIELRE